MDPNTLPTTIAVIAALSTVTLGAVAALRKQVPKIDGNWVYLVICLVAEAVTLMTFEPSEATWTVLRPLLWTGVKVAIGALSTYTGGAKFVQILGAAVASATPLAAVEAVAQMLTNSADRAQAQADDATKTPVTVIVNPPTATPAAVAAKIAPLVTGLVGLFLVALVALGCQGCKPGTLPPVSPTAVTDTIAGGCTVVPLLDPAGASAADVCETLAPVLGPIIAQVINDLGGDKKLPAAGDPSLLIFVPLTHGGAIVGHVRADIASAVQAKLDAVATPAAK